ncbi:hypothetical protein IWQ62_002634 [Dispira parvispora]|uniref:Protein YAE1 n=1 Tax=Dispira parvispora TaxID=1520584 RepID=A0A9W8AWC0_9FUNG|nr:hypothetical protein IWQ62_002634 [Dispira parvispora]
MSDSEDTWGEGSDLAEHEYDQRMAEREWNRLQDVHGKSGYAEGITEGRETHMQNGFDTGFHEGLRAGLITGLLQGGQDTLNRYLSTTQITSDTDEESITTASMADLNYFKLFDADYFSNPPKSTLPLPADSADPSTTDGDHPLVGSLLEDSTAFPTRQQFQYLVQELSDTQQQTLQPYIDTLTDSMHRSLKPPGQP